MSSEVEPVEVEAPSRPRVPEPEPVAVPEPPRRAGDALFDTGMGAGMGAPTAPTLLRQLSRRPPEERKSGIDDLNGRVGNRRVARMIAAEGPRLARRELGEPMLVPDGDALATALRTKDVGDIKMVWDFGPATRDERIEFIAKLLDQGWVGPNDEAALERIWASFKDDIVDVVDSSSDLWNLCVDRGMNPSNIPAVVELQKTFEADVKTLAKSYMHENLRFANEQMQKLGIEGEDDSPVAAMEQSLRMEEIQELAAGAEELLKTKDRMKEVVVGYDPVMSGQAGGARVPVTFDPGHKPVFDEPAWYQPGVGKVKQNWKTVKEQWDAADAAIAGITAQNPTVYAALAQGREQLTSLSEGTPEQARATASKVLTELRANIEKTIPKIDTGDLNWLDLKPIHQQLFGGRDAPSGTRWNEQLPKSAAEDVVGDHEATEFWIGLGLGAASAALFIVASVATGGVATAALLGGLAVSGGQAVKSWENYEDLATAAAGTATEETRLISEGQVSAAKIQAILDTIFAVMDFGQARGIVKGIQAGARMAEALAANSVETALEAGMREGGAGAAQAIERGIAELGAEAVARKTGKTADELLAMLPADSAMRSRIVEARQLIEAAAMEGTKDVTELEARVAVAMGSEAENAWVGTRSIGELLQDLPDALRKGVITPGFADKIVIEGIESIGPSRTLQRLGGWRKASQSLTDTSAAAERFMQWRNAVFADLEKYVRENLKGEIQRTGTASKFSNDIDMSFIGKNAAEVRDGATKYLAARLGVENTPAAFDRVMMAGLFTDPRRMHAYDGLPDAMRETIARTQAAKQEQLIWNRRLSEAVHEGDEALATHIRKEMASMSIPEFVYKPLSSGDVSRLSKRIDVLHGELDAAVEAGDTAAQQRLATEIGDAQALINAAEGGGYFSGGGVRRYVSERPGEKQFPRLPGEHNAGAIAAEKITALIDQLPKLDHSMLMLSGTTEDVIAGIRGIGKYGGRVFEVAGEAGEGMVARFKTLATRCAELKQAADIGAATMTAGEAKIIADQARVMFAEVQAKSSQILAEIRAGANIPNVGDVMGAIQDATIAHTRLLRSTEWTMRHISKLVRSIEQGRRWAELDEGQSEPGDQSLPNASHPDQNQSIDPSLQ